ncbi:MAG: 3-dehydroquinate synthase [Acidobacteria bacterium]|nr:3-dehydroquinate synthase [Acidobacteriota bacterium]
MQSDPQGDLPLLQFTIDYRFPVHFTRDLFSVENEIFLRTLAAREPNRRQRAAIVIDESVAAAHPGLSAKIRKYFAACRDFLELAGQPIPCAGGEKAKNDLSHLLSLLDNINQRGLDRQSFLVIIGGGAVLDVAGFAAAIAHRGIRTVRVPTTVLSQCDSGVGVKNGINLFGQKNFIGTFHPPFAVLNDVCFLDTLEHRDRIAGVAEAVKVALIRDGAFYQFLEDNATRLAQTEQEILVAAVRRSAELHLEHIATCGDPFELGSAKPLDFGHWSAHKLESMTHNRLRHGEAVAIGMALDLVYSVRRGYLHEQCAEQILTLLENLGFVLWDEALLQRDSKGRYVVLEGVEEFRQHLGGVLHITLIRDIGKKFEVHEMDEAAVVHSILWLAKRAEQRRRRPPRRAERRSELGQA